MEKIKTIIIVSLIVTVCSLGIASCTYLDVVPPEQAGLKDATKTRVLALGFLHSCYAALNDENETSINHGAPINGSTDEFVVPVEWRNTSFCQDYAYDLVSATNHDAGVWDKYYKYIGQCLLFQQQIEEAPGAQLLKEWLPGEKEEWLAESRFLIAYYHFALLRKYGPIPITDKYVSTDASSSEFGGRMHFDYCVNWIAKELDAVAEVLPAYREGTTWGRATSTIAKSIKARMLMYAASPLWNGQYPYPTWKNKVETPGDKDFFTGDDAMYKESIGRDSYGTELISNAPNPMKWERAMKACQAALDLAIGEGKCRLYGDGTQPSDFEMYNNQKVALPYIPGTVDDDFKKRVMMLRYMVASRPSDGNAEFVWGMTGGSMNGRIQGRLPIHIFQPGSGSAWAGGYAALSPTLFSMENFYTAEGKLPAEAANNGFPAKEDWFKSAGLSEERRADIIRLFVGREPRFYAWMAFDGGDYGSKLNTAGNTAGTPCTLNMKTAAGNGYDLSRNPHDYSVTGFMTQKYVNPLATFNYTGGVFNAGTGNPVPLIRIAELYLNLAECQANVGGANIAEALQNLNKIRARAGVPNVELSQTTDQRQFIQMIHNERFIELWNESHRYFDIRRWVEADIRLGAGKHKGLKAMVKNVSFEEFNTPTLIDQPFKWSNRLYLAPLSNDEVYKNPQMVQAYGY